MDCNFQQSDYLIKPLQEQMIKRLDLLRSAIVNEDWERVIDISEAFVRPAKKLRKLQK